MSNPRFLVRMRYDDTEATHVKDLVGGYTITTNTSSVPSASDPFGGNNALDLNDAWINYGGSKSIHGDKTTLVLWLKILTDNYNNIVVSRPTLTDPMKRVTVHGYEIGFSSSWRSALTRKVTGFTYNTWHYVEMNFDGDTFRIFIDGVLKTTNTDSSFISIDWKSENDSMVIGTMNDSTGADKLKGYICDFCILDGVWHTSNYAVPTSFISFNDVIYLTGQEAWGINGSGNFAKLSNNYSAMTDAEKIAMFNATGRQVPTISQLKTLTMPIKAVSYNDENTEPTCTVTAIPTPQTVTPKGRISLKNYAKLKGVSITGATSGGGLVKIAVTKDNNTYQVYDSTNLAWIDINIADIGTNGMSLADVSSLTSAEWLAYDCMDSGIGFAYYLEMASTSDTAYTDELTLNVELLGELKSLVKGTDYDYSYVSNDVLQVKLYKNGDFRINYNPGES